MGRPLELPGDAARTRRSTIRARGLARLGLTAERLELLALRVATERADVNAQPIEASHEDGCPCVATRRDQRHG